MSEKDYSEVGKLMGFGRKRAIEDRIKGGGKTVPDDFRCDAEQVEIDEKGEIIKSAPPPKRRK